MVKREGIASKDLSTWENQETTPPKRRYGILHLMGGLILLFIIIGILVNSSEKKEEKLGLFKFLNHKLLKNSRLKRNSKERVKKKYIRAFIVSAMMEVLAMIFVGAWVIVDVEEMHAGNKILITRQ